MGGGLRGFMRRKEGGFRVLGAIIFLIFCLIMVMVAVRLKEGVGCWFWLLFLVAWGLDMGLDGREHES